MSASTYLLGNGTLFSVSVNGGTTYTPVHELQSISFGSSKLDLEDITNLDSVGNYREYAPTLLDAGEVSINGIFIPTDAGQLACFAAFDARAVLTCKIQWLPTGSQTTGATTVFAAFQTERPSKDASVDKVAKFAAKFKVTGAFTETAGS